MESTTSITKKSFDFFYNDLTCSKCDMELTAEKIGKCPECKIARYCSFQCRDNDIEKHRKSCEYFRNLKCLNCETPITSKRIEKCLLSSKYPIFCSSNCFDEGFDKLHENYTLPIKLGIAQHLIDGDGNISESDDEDRWQASEPISPTHYSSIWLYEDPERVAALLP